MEELLPGKIHLVLTEIDKNTLLMFQEIRDGQGKLVASQSQSVVNLDEKEIAEMEKDLLIEKISATNSMAYRATKSRRS
jgi:hypothetical protein